MRVCQVCRGIRGHSSSVKLCRRMLLSTMLGISSQPGERRCRTVRKLIRCEVLPTLAIVRPEPEPATSTVHTVRTSAQPAQWGQKGSSCMEINFAPVAVQVAATKLTIKFGCVLCENTNSCPAWGLNLNIPRIVSWCDHLPGHGQCYQLDVWSICLAFISFLLSNFQNNLPHTSCTTMMRHINKYLNLSND